MSHGSPLKSAWRCTVCCASWEQPVARCHPDVPAAAVPANDPQIGEVIDGRYELLALLGEGGMGRVYLARQTAVGRAVAVKVVKADGAMAAARFRREALACSRLTSPHTVALVDYGLLAGGAPYMVTEILRGESLRARIRRGGALPLDSVVAIVDGACESLAEAHAAGLVHRDVKPENLFLARVGTSEQFLKVLDFGVAHFDTTDVDTALTAPGDVIGTPAYLSPEVARGAVPTPRSDLYSLAVTACELLTGVPPFRASTPLALVLMHLADEPDMSGLAHLPSTTALLKRCLSKDPLDRPQSAAELGRAFADAAARDQAAQGRPLVSRRRVGWLATAAATLVVSALAWQPWEAFLGGASDRPSRSAAVPDARDAHVPGPAAGRPPVAPFLVEQSDGSHPPAGSDYQEVAPTGPGYADLPAVRAQGPVPVVAPESPHEGPGVAQSAPALAAPTHPTSGARKARAARTRAAEDDAAKGGADPVPKRTAEGLPEQPAQEPAQPRGVSRAAVVGRGLLDVDARELTSPAPTRAAERSLLDP